TVARRMVADTKAIGVTSFHGVVLNGTPTIDWDLRRHADKVRASLKMALNDIGTQTAGAPGSK
ncbi:MAG: hypothetical protein ACYDGM_13180, partial [Vulcanimicrobiaceae bacterium]